MSKYAEWCEELEAALAEPFAPEHVQQKKIQGATISFVPWHRYVSRLNALVGGGWSMGDPIVREVAEKLVMGIPVTILGTTRVNFGDEDEDEYATVVDQQTGEETEKRVMYGSPCTNAFAQAFKRTCALFGMGLDMYDKARARANGNGRHHEEADNTAHCPKCGGGMYDNRADKKNAKAPDFKCKNKDCKTGQYVTAYWWPNVCEHVGTLATTAYGAGVISEGEAAGVDALIKKEDAPRVFAAWKYIEGKLDAAKVGATPNAGAPLSEPDDDMPY